MSNFIKYFKIACTKLSSIIRCSTASAYSTVALAPVEWRGALIEAEKAAAFPTSFVNLRILFNEDIALFAIRLRRLLDTNHPMLRSTKYILLGEKSNLQSLGLAILLVCKLAGYDSDGLCLTKSNTYDATGILNCQRVLAEIVEIKRNWHAIRRTNLLGDTVDSHVISDDNLTEFWNHYGLKDTGVLDLISAGEKDMDRAVRVGDRDPDNRPIPSQPHDDNIISPPFDWEKDEHLLDFEKFVGRARNEWTFRSMLTSGSILSKGCKAAVKVAKNDKGVHHTAFILGGHLALSWQLYLDIKDFYFNSDSFSLVGAPVMFAIEEYPEIYTRIEPAKEDYKLVDMRLLNKAVRCTRAIEKTKDFLEEEVDTCLKLITKFNNNEAKDVLKNMILAVHTESMGYVD